MIKRFFNRPIIIVCFIFYVLLTFVIFFFSLTDGKSSGEQSSFVWSIISTAFNINGNHEFLVRKLLGHFSVFIALAIFASVVYYRLVEIIFKTRITFYFTVFTLLAGLLTAIISEILQLPIFVNGRSAEIFDVLLDFFGYLLGFLIAFFILPIIYRKKTSKIKV